SATWERSDWNDTSENGVDYLLRRSRNFGVYCSGPTDRAGSTPPPASLHVPTQAAHTWPWFNYRFRSLCGRDRRHGQLRAPLLMQPPADLPVLATCASTLRRHWCRGRPRGRGGSSGRGRTRRQVQLDAARLGVTVDERLQEVPGRWSPGQAGGNGS